MLNEGSIKTKSKSMSGGEIKKSDLPKRKPAQPSKRTEQKRRRQANAAGVINAVQKAWNNSSPARVSKRTRNNEDDETIVGSGGLKCAKQAKAAVKDDDNLDGYNERMAAFANSLTEMGVKLN